MKAYKIQDVYTLSDIVENFLKKKLPEYSTSELFFMFSRFFNADQGSEYVFYSVEQVEEYVKEMITEFLEDLSPQESFAEKVARECEMELISDPYRTIQNKWRY